MSKYRKKACLGLKQKSNVIVVDSETDEFEELQQGGKKMKDEEMRVGSQKGSPY